MKFKYGDIITLKDNVKPVMSLDAETFFSLPDDEKAKVKTYWSLPEHACQLPPPAVGFSRLASRLAGTEGGGLHLRMQRLSALADRRAGLPARKR